MTNNLDATVFVFRHTDGSIIATYLDQAKAHEQNPALEHVATIEPRMWIQAHYDEIERTEVTSAQALERRNLELHVEIKRLRAALDKIPHRMTPDEEDGEPDYYADGWNDAIDAMLAIRERK